VLHFFLQLDDSYWLNITIIEMQTHLLYLLLLSTIIDYHHHTLCLITLPRSKSGRYGIHVLISFLNKAETPGSRAESTFEGRLDTRPTAVLYLDLMYGVCWWWRWRYFRWFNWAYSHFRWRWSPSMMHGAAKGIDCLGEYGFSIWFANLSFRKVSTIL
jgi:hypothetical protein